MTKNNFPSRQNLRSYQQKLLVFEKGHGLLKSKRDVLRKKYKKVEELLQQMDKNAIEKLNEGRYQLMRAEYYGADMAFMMTEISKFPYKIYYHPEVITGIKVYKISIAKQSAVMPAIFGKGSKEFLSAYLKCRESVSDLIKLASIKKVFEILKKELDNAIRRVNCLEMVLIPDTKKMINKIISELEESEREEFSRLKKIQTTIEREKK